MLVSSEDSLQYPFSSNSCRPILMLALRPQVDVWSLGITCVELGKFFSCLKYSHCLEQFSQNSKDDSKVCEFPAKQIGYNALQYHCTNVISSDSY